MDRVLEVHDAGATAGRGYGGVRHLESGAIAGVPALGQVSGELEVLALVVADGDEVGLVEQDVGRHEDRVGEQAEPGRLLAVFARLVLELGHPGQLAHAGGALEQPGQLGMLMDMALDEQGAPARGSPFTPRRVPGRRGPGRALPVPRGRHEAPGPNNWHKTTVISLTRPD